MGPAWLTVQIVIFFAINTISENQGEWPHGVLNHERYEIESSQSMQFSRTND